MQNELIHISADKDLTHTRKRGGGVNVERRPKGDILGGCSLNEYWGSQEEMERNIRALPEETRAILFDQEGEQEIDELVGDIRVIRSAEDIRKFISTFTPEAKTKKWTNEVLSRGKGEAIKALAFVFGRHLESGTFLKQWKEKLRRGDARTDIRDEIKSMIQKFWENGKAPVLSVDEIQSRREQYKAEIKRLEKERNRLEEILKKIAGPLNDRKAVAHLKEKAHEEFEKMYKSLGSRYSNQWNEESHKTGYITDFQRMIEMNEEELRDLDLMESGAMSIEMLFSRLKPMMDDSDVADLWGDVMYFVDPTTQEIYFEALMQWLDEVGEIVPEQEEISLSEKTQRRMKRLIAQFREAYRLVRNPALGADQLRNIHHVQLILRGIVRCMSGIKQSKAQASK